MAKDVITRFKLETTQYDSKLRDAAKGLSEYSKVATNAGKEFDKFTKSNVDAAKELGTMSTSTTNAKDRVKELVGAYNEAAKAYNQLTKEQQQSDWAKALSSSLVQLQQRISETKQEMMEVGNTMDDLKSKSSGLFGDGGFTGMLAVTGGNLLASGIQKLGAEMVDTIQQSVELARQGEGVRLAFERLNQPDLLDNLKEATHGTVSELELMKAAVKFDDFKLPVEQLGTLLAFAQKKAKDTGQSVDYMVDSIVTGLGRKSLMILDNLGLSAAEIKEKMKESGDMTTAVAAIIKEQMGEAGEYVETAADRAARAAADATNEMERLGREAQPFAEAWAGVWNEIKIGGMDLLTTVFGPLAESARQIRNILNGGGFKLKAGIPNLADGPAPSPTRQPGTDHKVQAPGGYVVVNDKNGKQIGARHFDSFDNDAVDAWKKNLLIRKTSGGSGGKTTTIFADDSIMAQEKLVQELTQKWKTAGEGVRDGYLKQLTDAQAKLDEILGRTKSVDIDKLFPDMSKQKYNTGYAGSIQSKIDSARQDMAMGPLNIETVNSYIGIMKNALKDADFGTDLYNSLSESMKDATTMSTLLQELMERGMDGADLSAVAENFKSALLDGDIPDDDIREYIEKLNEKIREAGGVELAYNDKTGEVSDKKEEKKNDEFKEFNQKAGAFISGLSSVSNGLKGLGLQLPEGVDQLIGAMSSVMQVIQGVQTIISVFSTSALVANTAAVNANTFALLARSFGFGLFANGGVVHAANGWSGNVPGTSYSGDNIPIMVNSGELILNRAQQGNIASQLEGGGLGDLQLELRVDAEDFIIMLNNNGKRRGLGRLING